MRKAVGRGSGGVLLAVVLLAAGLAGLAALWAAWPRTPNTSPLAALFALVWSCTYLAAGLLTWRGTRVAAFVFLAAIGLLLPVLFFLFPGGRLHVLPSFVITVGLGLLGYRYLRASPARHVTGR